MVCDRLLQFCHYYALVMGATTRRHLDEGHEQTRLSSAYALVVNVLTVCLLPWAFWTAAHFVKEINLLPSLLEFTTDILYTVSYVTIVYTLISRVKREDALKEVERTVRRLKQHQVGNGTETACTKDALVYLYLLKLVCVVLLCVISSVSCLLVPHKNRWRILLSTFITSNAMNIPLLAIYRYFLAMWDIANSYRYLGIRLVQLLSKFRRNKRYAHPTRGQLEELKHLWLLHSRLGRCTCRLTRIYELLILAARVDNMAFIAINGYWGIVFSFTHSVPFLTISFGCFNYLLHMYDFYLLNFVCDQTERYQNSTPCDLFEVPWFKELNAFVLYARSTRLNLWVCGLYKVDRRSWFQMQASILSFSILLLQYHLILKKKYTL